jgi:hypothetical protein
MSKNEMDEDELQERIDELEILLSGAQSAEEAEYIQKLIYDLEDKKDELKNKKSD